MPISYWHFRILKTHGNSKILCGCSSFGLQVAPSLCFRYKAALPKDKTYSLGVGSLMTRSAAASCSAFEELCSIQGVGKGELLGFLTSPSEMLLSLVCGSELGHLPSAYPECLAKVCWSQLVLLARDWLSSQEICELIAGPLAAWNQPWWRIRSTTNHTPLCLVCQCTLAFATLRCTKGSISSCHLTWEVIHSKNAKYL